MELNKINNSPLKQNAKDLLWVLMQRRNWYNGLYQKDKASSYKSLAKKNILSYEKSVEILEKLGYERIENETWKLKE